MCEHVRIQIKFDIMQLYIAIAQSATPTAKGQNTFWGLRGLFRVKSAKSSSHSVFHQGIL